MDTWVWPPGERVPLDGLKFAPTLLLAVQLIFSVELRSPVKITVHGPITPQVLPFKVVGLTDQSGGGGGVAADVQLQGTETVLSGPMKLNMT